MGQPYAGTNGTASHIESRSGLLRTVDELWDLRPGEYVQCHDPACGAEYGQHDVYTLDVSDREHVRCVCGKSGFMLRGSKRNQSVAERRPMLSGTFYPSASELRDYGHCLGLDGIDRLTIEAIDSFPSNWDVTYEDIAVKAGIKVGRVKATLKKLREHEGGALIESEWCYFAGRRRGAIYDLTPLWNALAAQAAKDAEERETQDSAVTTGDIRPKTTGEIGPYLKPLEPLDPKRTFSSENAPCTADAVTQRFALPSSKPRNSGYEGEHELPPWAKPPGEIRRQRLAWEAEHEVAA